MPKKHPPFQAEGETVSNLALSVIIHGTALGKITRRIFIFFDLDCVNI
jgi:hypothetical protein